MILLKATMKLSKGSVDTSSSSLSMFPQKGKTFLVNYFNFSIICVGSKEPVVIELTSKSYHGLTGFLNALRDDFLLPILRALLPLYETLLLFAFFLEEAGPKLNLLFLLSLLFF